MESGGMSKQDGKEVHPSGDLKRTITPAQGVALYVGAVVGTGVLILPGTAASLAGPASVVAWAFVSLLGIPLALTFAALAGRYPDAGGVATFTGRAFGPGRGAAVGWFYFFASANALAVMPLIGAYYASVPLGFGRGGAYLLGASMLACAVASNAGGLRVSGRVQLALSSCVAALLLSAALVSVPSMSLENWAPFAPEGWGAVGRVAVLLLWAVFGWEAIAQLAAEFENAGRDVPRSTLYSVGLIVLLYVGVAAAVVGTATYGSAAVDRVAVATLLGNAMGASVAAVASFAALVITLATVNAYVAATSRLGYALARDGVFPAQLSVLDARGVPLRAVFAAGVLSACGMLICYAVGWGPEDLLVVSTSLGLATYVLGTAAGAKLLRGEGRLMAVVALLMCLVMLPFAGALVSLPIAVATAAWSYRRLRTQSRKQNR
jgi:amino acid efflux transporter